MAGSFLSAVGGNIAVTDIMFYVNLVLFFCAVTAVATLGVLRRKTACEVRAGIAALCVFALGLVAFLVQLLLYVCRIDGARYAVGTALSVMYAAFIEASLYCFVLSRKSNRALCLATGIFCLVPPVGAIFLAVLSVKVRHDTPMQALVFGGYPYTYAALAQYCSVYKPEFEDSAGVEGFERLSKKEISEKLRSLKKDRATAEGKYRYASAVAEYDPENMIVAVKYMRKAAEENYAPALFNLGYWHEVGAHVKKDEKKAREFYTRAAEGGDGDAKLRLGILEIKTGNVRSGTDIFRARADEGDVCALYNLGVCAEKGCGCAPDEAEAVEIYGDCADKGSVAAERRLFAIAARDINTSKNDELFRKITERPYYGMFSVMMAGLIDIKNKLASDAADKLLGAVKSGRAWTGIARCLVGTLYIDCGKQYEDRLNGADYVASSVEIFPAARSVYSVLPRDLKRAAAKRRRSKRGKSEPTE